MTILQFKPKEEKENTVQGAARCLDCRYEWRQVIAAQALMEQDYWLECPKCECHKGRMKFPFEIGEEHWQCNCGNKLFAINDRCTYCPNCGQEQVFP